MLDPLFRSVRDAASASGWGPWVVVQDARCVVDVDLAGAVAAEFKRLPLAAPAVSVPPNGWVMVNMDAVVFTSGESQELAATVVGVDVVVRARPVGFAWNFGDGSVPVVSTGPGAPYPVGGVAHVYGSAGRVVVGLTTTWAADFQVVGSGVWEPVVGTATTTSAGAVLEVVAARSHLVDAPLG